MYSVYADDVCIYNDSFMLEDAIIIEPVLTLEANAAGSFELTLPPTNKAYDTVERLKTEIKVKKEVIRNGEKVKDEIWSGRIVSDEKDYWNNRKLICEGELAYLNDTVQPMAEYHENKKITIQYNPTTGKPQKVTDSTFRGDIKSFLGELIENHNFALRNDPTAANMDKQFMLGNVDAGGGENTPIYRYTNFEKTIEAINEKLLDKYEGFLVVRKEGLFRYLDFLDQDSPYLPAVNTQTIDFGENLVDFVRSWNSEEFATILLPLGARQETSTIEALEDYLTVAGQSDPAIVDDIYVQNDTLVSLFGKIVKVVHWDDVTVARNLLTKAKDYLAAQQYDKMTIELSALDLHYLDPTIQDINLYDRVVVKSKPHGLTEGITLPVTKLEIPLDNPESTVFTLGTEIKTSMTDVNNKTSAELLNKIDNQRSSILDEANSDASAIMNLKTTGYITIANDDVTGYSNALYISDNPDLSQTRSYWKWFAGGLGHTSDGGEHWDVAIGMNGEIDAQFIKTGTMSADRVRAGRIVSTNGKTILDLDDGTFNVNNGKFVVDANGNLTANSATVKGTFFAGSNTGNNYWVQLTADGKLTGGQGNDEYGYIDYTASVDISGTSHHGMKMASDILYLSLNSIYVRAHNQQETALLAKDVQFENVPSNFRYDSTDGKYHWTNNTLNFVHGILCVTGSSQAST